MITAPAAFSRATTTASSVGRQSLKAGMPQVVGRPATLNDSFTVIGRPSSGLRSPRASAWSAAIAAWRARSKSRTTTALMDLSSASMRAIAWSSSSTAETRRAARSATSSPAVRYHLPTSGGGGTGVAVWPNPRVAVAVPVAAHAAVTPTRKARRPAVPTPGLTEDPFIGVSPLPASPEPACHDAPRPYAIQAGDAPWLSATTRIDRLLLGQEIADFLYREAELLDERRYREWLALLADDIRYWMPMRRNVKFGEDEREFTRADSDINWFDEGKETLAGA